MDKKQSTSLKFDWTVIVEPDPYYPPPDEMYGCGGGGGGGGGGCEFFRPIIRW